MAECDVAEWELAKEKILHGAINGLKAPDDFVALKDGAWLQWIDDGDFRTEGRDLDALRTHFRSFRTTEAFVPGMLRDIFLVVDSESLRSIMCTDEKDKPESFVIAVDAQYDVTEKLPLSSAGPKPTPRDYSLASGWTTKYNYPDFPGYLKFDLDLIFSVLYPELVRSAPLDKYWKFDEDWQTLMNLSSSQKEQVGV